MSAAVRFREGKSVESCLKTHSVCDRLQEQFKHQ